jgi:hypothetical protein
VCLTLQDHSGYTVEKEMERHRSEAGGPVRMN